MDLLKLLMKIAITAFSILLLISIGGLMGLYPPALDALMKAVVVASGGGLAGTFMLYGLYYLWFRL